MQLQCSEIFTFLLGTIASLALLVGGIGIVNIKHRNLSKPVPLLSRFVKPFAS